MTWEPNVPYSTFLPIQGFLYRIFYIEKVTNVATFGFSATSFHPEKISKFLFRGLMRSERGQISLEWEVKIFF